MKVRKILFPTDLSPESEAAKNFAKVLAKKHGAELLLLHEVLTHAHDFRQLGDLLTDFLDKLEADARARLEEECKGLKNAGLVASCIVERNPSAYEAIKDKIEEWEPDVVVMGTHGRSGVDRWIVGSVAEKIVRHAPVPVVTVRSDAKPVSKIDKILVPVDFSDNSRRAVAAAAQLKGTKGSLGLLHVVLNPAFAGLHPEEYIRVFGVDPSLPDRLRDRMKDWMEGQPFEADVREADDVADCILQATREKKPDLVVMGTRGLTGLDYFLMGSVAEKVVRFSPVAVLCVK
ncbi:MAG TPA: universal stress protein [Vicinamibacteria bacterium]|nr:universal stress protein [Vicinamibacteria bacterium]